MPDFDMKSMPTFRDKPPTLIEDQKSDEQDQLNNLNPHLGLSDDIDMDFEIQTQT